MLWSLLTFKSGWAKWAKKLANHGLCCTMLPKAIACQDHMFSYSTQCFAHAATCLHATSTQCFSSCSLRTLFVCLAQIKCTSNRAGTSNNVLKLPNLHLNRVASAMDAALRRKVAQVKDDQTLPVNTKWIQIRDMLQSAGHLYQLEVAPAMLLVHPSNRAGGMLSWYDCHEKGSRILACGPDLSKIQESVAIELATYASKRQSQLQANKDLVNASAGQLAKVSGQERYLSLGSSHLSQFCKAVFHNANTEHQELMAMCNGTMSIEALTQGQPATVFQKMCTTGWKWSILQACVEDCFPDLPCMVQQALNASHGVAMGSNEVEVMTHVAASYHHCHNLQQALAMATMTKRKCMPYVQALAHYVKHYSGGETFPIIQCLQHVSTWQHIKSIA